MAENFCETPARAAGIPDIERGALIPEAFRWVAEAKGSRNRLTGLHTNKQKRPAGWAGRVFLRAIKRFSSVRGRHGAPCTDAARGHYRYLSPGNAPLSMWSCHRVRGRFSLTIPPGASWRSEPSQGWSAARPRPTAHVRSHSLPPATLRTKPSI